MILQIPLSEMPNQLVAVDLEEKHCVLELITRNGKMYANKIAIDDNVMARGIACLNRNNLLSFFNSGLGGKLYFFDTKGSKPPKYYGLNSRWLLIYED